MTFLAQLCVHATYAVPPFSKCSKIKNLSAMNMCHHNSATTTPRDSNATRSRGESEAFSRTPGHYGAVIVFFVGGRSIYRCGRVLRTAGRLFLLDGGVLCNDVAPIVSVNQQLGLPLTPQRHAHAATRHLPMQCTRLPCLQTALVICHAACFASSRKSQALGHITFMRFWCRKQ